MASAVPELPSEILADIFLHLASELQETAKPRRWIYASHVCSAWRRAALEDCRLWSTPSFNHDVELTRKMLDRARAAPLHIVLDFNRPCSSSCLELAFGNLHRARSFTIYGVIPLHHVAFIKTLYSETVFQAPSLHSITISSKILSGRTASILDVISLNPPWLRSLTLQNWRLPQSVDSSPGFTGLTSLEIVMSDDSETDSPKKDSFPTIIGYLGTLQRLRRLHLQNVFRGHNGSVLGSPPGIILPDLKELTLRTYRRAWVLFLSTVTFPQDATVSVSGGKGGFFYGELAGLCIKRLRDPIRAIHVQQSDIHMDIDIKFWTIPCDEDLGYTEQHPILSLTIPRISAERFPPQYLQNAEHLSYQTTNQIWNWMEGVQHAERLTLLDIHGTDTSLYQLLEAHRGWGPALPDGSRKRRMSLPALCDLTLNEWDFKFRDIGYVYNHFQYFIKALQPIAYQYGIRVQNSARLFVFVNRLDRCRGVCRLARSLPASSQVP